MRNKQYKYLQREINRSIRALNDTVANDSLWRGRFYARQQAIRFATYADKSGVWAIAKIAFIDKQTNVQHIVWLDNKDINGLGKRTICGYRIWEVMNNFIIKQTESVGCQDYYLMAIDYTPDRRWSKQ